MDKTIGCILIVLVLTLVPIFPMANATTLGLHDLVAGGIETATITCQANERVSGSFNISSASAIDDSIIFSIRDPLEKTISILEQLLAEKTLPSQQIITALIH